jgi:hypothetical protein
MIVDYAIQLDSLLPQNMLLPIVLASALVFATVSSSVLHAVSWGTDTSHSSLVVHQGDTAVWQADQDSASHSIASLAIPSGPVTISPGTSFYLNVTVPPGSYEVYNPQSRNSTTSWLRVLPNPGIPGLTQGQHYFHLIVINFSLFNQQGCGRTPRVAVSTTLHSGRTDTDRTRTTLSACCRH